jgi:hypothetical protein
MSETASAICARMVLSAGFDNAIIPGTNSDLSAALSSSDNGFTSYPDQKQTNPLTITLTVEPNTNGTHLLPSQLRSILQENTPRQPNSAILSRSFQH